MWAEANRKKYDRRYQIYPSELNNEEWQLLEPMLSVAKGVGRPRVHTLREIVNGIRYVQKYCIPWDAMPKDLPLHSICYDLWRLLTDQHHIEQINHLLMMANREKAGRDASPTLAIIDAQSIKCDAPDGDRGYDLTPPLISYEREGFGECFVIADDFDEPNHERAEAGFRHVRDEVVEEPALAEEGMGASFGGVGLEETVHAEAFAGGTE